MTLIRKATAGNASHANWTRPPGSADHGAAGEPVQYEWPEDGAVVDVAPEHAQVLTRIQDGGFTEVLPTGNDDQDDEDGAPAGDLAKATSAAKRATARRIRE